MKAWALELLTDINDWIKAHPLAVSLLLAGLIIGVIIGARS